MKYPRSITSMTQRHQFVNPCNTLRYSILSSLNRDLISILLSSQDALNFFATASERLLLCATKKYGYLIAVDFKTKLFTMPLCPKASPIANRTSEPPPNYPPADLDIPSLLIFEPPSIQGIATTNLPHQNLSLRSPAGTREKTAPQPCQTIRRQIDRGPNLEIYSLVFRRDQLLLGNSPLVVPPQAQSLYHENAHAQAEQETGKVKVKQRASSTNPKEFQTTTLCMFLQ